LGDNWDIVLVDIDEDRLSGAAEIRAVEPIAGDGSSALVLNRAGIDGAAVVAVLTGSDEVNLEPCFCSVA
jgi:Trk K+ transport system NAD-binding subunit